MVKVGLEFAPHRVADAAFQRAQRFLLRLALSELAFVVRASRRVMADLGDGDEVQRAVELPVAARVQPVPRTRSR